MAGLSLPSMLELVGRGSPMRFMLSSHFHQHPRVSYVRYNVLVGSPIGLQNSNFPEMY